MSSTAWSWLLTIIGTVASVGGVLFSWRAWAQAKGARKAAEEASIAVKAKDTAHEFSRLAADAKDLLTAVQERRVDRAIQSANDLAHLLKIAVERRFEFLPEDQELQSTIGQLQTVSRYLSSKGFPAEIRDTELLTRRCQGIHQAVCKAQGNLERRVEGAYQ